MGEIVRLSNPDSSTVRQLLRIWQSSMESSHHFLTKEDIGALRPAVKRNLVTIGGLYGFCNDEGRLLAFMGVHGDMIEMLFVREGFFRQGIGGTLVRYAIQSLQVRRVDVNDQNRAAADFFQHMGFSVTDTSKEGRFGNYFPILHMQLSPPQSDKPQL